MQLIDLPGHERLLSLKLDQYKSMARCVGFTSSCLVSLFSLAKSKNVS